MIIDLNTHFKRFDYYRKFEFIYEIYLNLI